MVGGGDGGTLREVAKHSCVEEIHICELDTVCVCVCGGGGGGGVLVD